MVPPYLNKIHQILVQHVCFATGLQFVLATNRICLKIRIRLSVMLILRYHLYSVLSFSPPFQPDTNPKYHSIMDPLKAELLLRNNNDGHREAPPVGEKVGFSNYSGKHKVFSSTLFTISRLVIFLV